MLHQLLYSALKNAPRQAGRLKAMRAFHAVHSARIKDRQHPILTQRGTSSKAEYRQNKPSFPVLVHRIFVFLVLMVLSHNKLLLIGMFHYTSILIHPAEISGRDECTILQSRPTGVASTKFSQKQDYAALLSATIGRCFRLR